MCSLLRQLRKTTALSFLWSDLERRRKNTSICFSIKWIFCLSHSNRLNHSCAHRLMFCCRNFFFGTNNRLYDERNKVKHRNVSYCQRKFGFCLFVLMLFRVMIVKIKTAALCYACISSHFSCRTRYKHKLSTLYE